MSAFDQTLAEARDVNRLEDTFTLWKNICSSRLLSNVSIVLLLNKRDILQKKLEMGISFSRYVKSYQGANKWEAVAKYLKTKFKAVQRELSPEKRLYYAHITCATDVKQMSAILAASSRDSDAHPYQYIDSRQASDIKHLDTRYPSAYMLARNLEAAAGSMPKFHML
ncbi:hypothetical protein M422DRAFT_260997 [Sphaerobolus stellatus SS14]|uniref:Guanine nucleotide-binding protein subunit alpha n=1 Tax=Sphaerobolus stellatus (strain SS14) TaxID=990650 RepID=A0A0C9V4K8_SPHS4|nr:hypothetical protein M422DRAFT_260997 [Sphaerobolus stellatus SS14]